MWPNAPSTRPARAGGAGLEAPAEAVVRAPGQALVELGVGLVGLLAGGDQLGELALLALHLAVLAGEPVVGRGPRV